MILRSYARKESQIMCKKFYKREKSVAFGKVCVYNKY